jgi:hypothetical protein
MRGLPVHPALALVLICAAAACGDAGTQTIGGCKVRRESPSGGWDGDPYELHPFIATVAYYQFEDGACPVAILRRAEPVYAAGTLFSAQVFNQQGLNDTERARLRIFSADRTQLQEDIQPFRILNADEKRADVDVEYPAMTASYDVGSALDFFNMTVLDYCCPLPQQRAEVELGIDYVSDAPLSRVAITGDEVPLARAAATWGALSRSAGRPHEYRWHRDGVYVGTGATYTANAGTADFDLRVDMTDTYGRAATHTLRVDVDGVRVHSLAGPGQVYAGEGDAIWSARGHGGYPPYTFEWLVDGVPVGSGEEWSGFPGEGQHTLTARMRDSRGASHSRSMVVQGFGGGDGTCEPVPPQITCSGG